MFFQSSLQRVLSNRPHFRRGCGRFSGNVSLLIFRVFQFQKLLENASICILFNKMTCFSPYAVVSFFNETILLDGCRHVFLNEFSVV